MSLFYREHGHAYVPDFSEENGDPVRTSQSYADSCDVNKILKKHQITNVSSHMVQYPPEVYAEFDGSFGLLEASDVMARAREIFAACPSEVRNEYNNDALLFCTDMNKRINAGEDISKLLPAIAQPGSYFPNPVKRGGTGAGAATPPQGAPKVSDPAPASEVASAANDASAASEAASASSST